LSNRSWDIGHNRRLAERDWPRLTVTCWHWYRLGGCVLIEASSPNAVA
jgi:hypothetical protein